MDDEGFWRQTEVGRIYLTRSEDESSEDDGECALYYAIARLWREAAKLTQQDA